MRIKAAIIVLIISFFAASSLAAQNIDNVQFPFSVKWKKIETENCIIIFPSGMEDKAEDAASVIDSYYPAVEKSLVTEASKWPVIINNTLAYTNGYVLGAPAHSQLYTIHPQVSFSGSADWLPFLWSHELRHIVQNEKMLRGFTAFASWIAGEYGMSGMSNFALPRWVWEGDAVLTETLLSSGGRGRIADFDLVLRTKILEGDDFNYATAVQGTSASYDSRIPSYYVTGYNLCTYIRKEYGLEAFNRILEISADYSFVPLILNIAVKKVTGVSIEKVYENCLDELESLWSKQLENRIITEAEIIKSGGQKDYTSYYPLGNYNSGLAAVKTSGASGVELVTIDIEGKEKKLRKISPIDLNISFNGETFCWSESVKDVRWGNRSWSVIRIYNPGNSTYRLLTDKTRYFSPSISPDGGLIAAVEITESLDNYITVIDSETAEIVYRFREPDGAAPSQTCWTEDSSTVIYVRQQDWMKSLRTVNLESGINSVLTTPSVYNINSPSAAGGNVYYISDASGIDSIHVTAVDHNSGRMLVSRAYGTETPTAAGNKLYFAEYSLNGYAIASVNLSKTSGMEVPPSDHVDYFKPVEQQEPFAGMAGPGLNPGAGSGTDDEDVYKIENYYPAAGLFNFHSTTLGLPLSRNGIAIGLKADSIMNDSSGTAYSGYDSGEAEIVAGFNGAYAGFYPVLLYGAELQTPANAPAAILESTLYAGAWLPLDFSRGNINNTLALQSMFLLENRLYPYPAGSQAVRTSIDYSLNMKSARRDLIPPLGINLSASWYKTITAEGYSFVLAETTLYLPGVLKNQGIQIGIQANWNTPEAELIKTPEKVPRGISPEDFEEQLILNSSFDYIIPLAYPDLSIGNLFYIPRLFMSCFTDTAYIPGKATFLQTAGLEFYADFHLINHYYPFRAGLRIIYNTINGRIKIEDTVIGIGIELL